MIRMHSSKRKNNSNNSNERKNNDKDNDERKKVHWYWKSSM